MATKIVIEKKVPSKVEVGDTILVGEYEPWNQPGVKLLCPGTRKTLDKHAKVLRITSTLALHGGRKRQRRYEITTTIGTIADVAPIHRISVVKGA